MYRALLAALVISPFVACSQPMMQPVAATGKATVTVVNGTLAPATVNISFGADSVVLPATLPFCTSPAPLVCSFQLGPKEARVLPLGGRYLNATFAFNGPVGCGSTKAEVNVNNPKWYDVLDVSLVDGFSNAVRIETGTVVLEALKATGNEKALGVYPLGCDICVARQRPPCGQQPGRDGCKAGSQYAPAVPCQWQGSAMGGGTPVRVVLVP